jgi:hypothetical protein
VAHDVLWVVVVVAIAEIRLIAHQINGYISEY